VVSALFAARSRRHPLRSFVSVVFAFVFVFGLTAATRLHAATLRGTVMDPQGTVVASARVVVVGPLGARHVYTDAEGRYEITDLSAGTYRILAEASGFSADAQSVTLGTSDDRTLALSLAVGGVSESVVVSAAQVEVAESDAPASVHVLTADDLRSRQVDNLGDALREVPGLSVARNGGRGALTAVFPRGGESDYTLVLVDGMRLNSFGGGIDLAQLALDNIERIEVVTGPQSALFGADAIGGVVQVVTAHDGPVRVEGLAEGGSESTSRALVTTSGSAGAWNWSGGFQRSASDGFTGTAPANGETVSNDDWWQRQVSGSFGWQPSSSGFLRLNARRLESERGSPGPYGSNPIDAFPGVDRVSRGSNDDRQVGIVAQHDWGQVLSGRIRQRHSFSTSRLGSDFVSSFGTSEFTTKRLDFRTQTDLLLSPATTVTGGLEAQGEQARSTYITGSAAQEVPVKRSTIGFFGELRKDAGTSVAITAGLRVDRIRRSALEESPDPFSPRPAFPEDAIWSTNPRVSLTWSAWRADDGRALTRVHGSAGTGIRPPDAFEIAFTDNPNLKPERSRSVEVGVTQNVGRLPVEFGVTYFHNSYDDLIVAVGKSLEDASQYKTDNVSNARAQGIELNGSWTSNWGLGLHASYTWLDTEILAVDKTAQAPAPFEVGDPLIRRPKHQANVGVLYDRGRIAAFFDVGGRGKTLDVEPNFGAFGGLFPSKGYAVADTGVTVHVHRMLDAFARVTNLFDRSYEEVLGYPALGRSAIGGLRVAFSR
jgi:outer membrane cobalamin receptor